MKRFILTGAPGAGKALSRYPGLPTSSLLAAEIGRIARQELFGRAVFIVRNRAPMNAPDPVALGRESLSGRLGGWPTTSCRRPTPSSRSPRTSSGSQ